MHAHIIQYTHKQLSAMNYTMHVNWFKIGLQTRTPITQPNDNKLLTIILNNYM